SAVRLLEQNAARRGPIQTKWSVADFVEQVQVLNGGVIDPEGSADTRLARTSKDLTHDTVGESGRVRKADPRSEVFIVRGRQGRRNAGVSRNHPTFGSGRKLRGLQPGHDGFDLPLGVIPRHAYFPPQAEV